MSIPSSPEVTFPGLVDLASARVGGVALATNDDFFAGKENLIKPEPAVFLPDEYTDRGKWMDGWESRRRRTPGHDWCVLRLGVPGAVRGVEVDTSFFLGNAPAEAELWGLAADGGGPDPSTPRDPAGDPESWRWRPLVARSPLRPGARNVLLATGDESVSHVRLDIFPDGGVARLRVWGEPRPRLPPGALIDRAALINGARAVAASDMFFGRMEHLTYPGRPRNMGEGWESRRRRGPGHDWAIVRLAGVGTIERIEVDTTHFKGNYPDRCSLDACLAGHLHRALGPLDWEHACWWPLVGETRLGPDATHVLTDLLADAPCDHVRLNVFPDGGVARLRVFGRLTAEPEPGMADAASGLQGDRG